MANGATGVATGGAALSEGVTGDFEAVFAQSAAIQEQAIVRSVQVSSQRTEAGSAREAARNANLQ